ncbi:MAG: hypothetical protein V4655_03285 [Bdellovibrionota bacterium]|nr:MAG: hypothetical protein EOP09_08415 [Pseudomonadota bacterium]
MVSRLALFFVLHVIVLGIWSARRPATAKIGYWWKPFLYFLAFYLIWGILFSQKPSLVLPG